MRALTRSRWRRAMVALALSVYVGTASAAKKPEAPVLRWARGAEGCTFTAGEDGKYHYTLASGDYTVSMAVDSQELAHIPRRIEPFFSVFLEVSYRGKAALAVNPQAATLEFTKHYKVVQPALDPESFAQRTQDDADQLEFETEHEIQKHPERKDERERYVQAYQKEVAEFLDFLSRNSLPAVQLDSGHPEASGWVYFSTRSKWLGSWKTPEQFVLRLPLADRMVEFPFALPPEEGDLILRRRPE